MRDVSSARSEVQGVGVQVSATGRSDVRERDDLYETPAWAVRAILPHLQMVAEDSPPRRILDPFAGRGAILEVVKEEWRWPLHLRGIELDEGRAAEANRAGFEVVCTDAFGAPVWGAPHLVLTNPPYKYAERAIRHALTEKAPGGECAFLLRVNFLGSQERATFHRSFPSDVFILPRRPSFAVSWKCVSDYEVRAGLDVRKCDSHGMVGKRSDGVPMGEVPEVCPACKGAVRTSSSDATEYAWFVWGPMRGGRWSILEVPS
jgi:hypothetical protein